MAGRSKYLLKRYGITEHQYADLLRKQEGRCAICRRPASAFKIAFAVDHDHSTKEIRGLLCNYCNRRIVGRHRKDGSGPQLLKAAYEYLTKTYTGWIIPKKKYVRKKRR